MQALTLIASLGAIQGGIILLSILFRFRHRKNLPLSILLIVFSARLATIPTWNPDILLSLPWIYPATAPLPFLFGPLLWWYIRELASDRLIHPKSLLIHFVPYFLELSALIFTLISMTDAEYLIFITDVFSGNPPLWLPVRNGLKVVLNIMYIFLAAKTAFGVKSEKLSGSKKLCARLLIIIPSGVLAAFAYVALPPSVTQDLAGGFVLPFFILTTAMAVLIYGISFLLIVSPEITRPEIISSNKLEQLCTDEECRRIMSFVNDRLDSGAFHNPDLVLRDLASEFNIHPNRISFAVNKCCSISFRTLLNRKRVEFFMSMVSSGKCERSILEIAFDAGFPSKSTFNRVFKEETGMTPTAYLESETENNI